MEGSVWPRKVTVFALSGGTIVSVSNGVFVMSLSAAGEHGALFISNISSDTLVSGRVASISQRRAEA